MKDKEVHGLLKIPSEVVISQLRVELGKAESRIQELTDALKTIKSQIDNKKIKETRLAHLEQEIEKYKLKNKELTETVVTDNKKIVLLQKQLFDGIKRN